MEDDLTNRLEQAKAIAIQAEFRSLAKSNFLACLNHEMRNPLNGVLGLMAMLEDTGLDEHQLEYLQVAIQAGDRLLLLAQRCRP